MAGKTTPLSYGSRKSFGEMHAKLFDMEKADDCNEYASLRTRSNDAKAGISIEHVKELIKNESKTTVDNGVTTTEKVDHYLLFVEWWERKPAVEPKGDRDEAPQWSKEKVVSVPDPPGDGSN